MWQSESYMNFNEIVTMLPWQYLPFKTVTGIKMYVFNQKLC